jgi:hypothetical protein
MPALDKLILGNIVRGGGVHLRHFLLRGQGPLETHYSGYMPFWSTTPKASEPLICSWSTLILHTSDEMGTD